MGNEQRQQLDALLADAETRGWQVKRGKGYPLILCPCGEHMETVHLTPSSPNYFRNKRRYLERYTCWEA
jgi:hypothetical protein